jgi:hypothetical protein
LHAWASVPACLNDLTGKQTFAYSGVGNDGHERGDLHFVGHRECGARYAPPTLQIQALKASTSSEIDAAFANLDQADALFVGPDGFFNTRREGRGT